jgi:hypothetical protein
MSQNNSTPLPPPALQEATKNSTSVWQENLEELFRNAKDRFPDVVWEVGDVCGGDMMKDVDMDVGGLVEEVWGHKGSRPCFVFLFIFLKTFSLCSDCICSCPPFFSNSLFLIQTSNNIAYW